MGTNLIDSEALGRVVAEESEDQVLELNAEI